MTESFFEILESSNLHILRLKPIISVQVLFHMMYEEDKCSVLKSRFIHR